MAKTKRKKKNGKKRRSKARATRSPKRRPRRGVLRARTAGRGLAAKHATAKRQMASAGALPLAGDNSIKGRRRLKLARRLGLKIR